uniref:Uncharacterized protein n=1 Tax=Oryza punctata TaxID=4537 RepID=A0A0E0M6H7_ORYPU
MDATFLAWNFMGNRDAERMVFHYLTSTAQAAAAKADILLCNTFTELEPTIFTQKTPATIFPIGPLRTGQRSAGQVEVVGHFWQTNDNACHSFLDEQPYGSVVYVAFGSLTVMSPEQLKEIALGLEASGRPFIWVVRSGLASNLPTSFLDPIMGLRKGRVVEWAPQERVLAHPAVGCFVTHCGWNSTVESIRNGVPMLCWPYFTDQFTNQIYICDIWRIGLKMLQTSGGGIVTKEIVTKKIMVQRLEELLLDEGIKERVQRLKEFAETNMNEEGESIRNFNAFVELLTMPMS